MTVRLGMAKDIDPKGGKYGIISLFREMHQRSTDRDQVMDEKYVREMLLRVCFQNPRRAAPGETALFVSERNGEIDGMILPTCDRYYHIGVKWMVSDLFFYVRENAHVRSASDLWLALENWANVPSVLAIRPGITNAIGDWSRTAKFFKRRGYTQIGGIFQRNRSAEAVRSAA